jgi:hypothetical protein
VYCLFLAPRPTSPRCVTKLTPHHVLLLFPSLSFLSCHRFSLINRLTACNKALLLKLTVAELVMELLVFYGTPKVHHRIHKSPPPVPILSQMNPIDIFTTYCPRIHLNIILPFTPSSSNWCLPFRFSIQNFAGIFRLPYMYSALSVCVTLLMCKTKFHTHTKQQAKL